MYTKGKLAEEAGVDHAAPVPGVYKLSVGVAYPLAVVCRIEACRRFQGTAR